MHPYGWKCVSAFWYRNGGGTALYPTFPATYTLNETMKHHKEWNTYKTKMNTAYFDIASILARVYGQNQ